LRGDVSVPLQIYKLHERDLELTNQKMKFDIDLSGKWLAVGDQKGYISIFDVFEGQGSAAHNDAEIKSQTLRYNAHSDAVGSVAFHPLRPLLLSASGSRHFHDYSDESNSESSDEETPMTIMKRPLSTLDSTTRLWRFEGSNVGVA